MTEQQKNYYEKRGQQLVENLKKRHFDAHYCATKEDALCKALELIPEGSKVGWGGALSAGQIGLQDALRNGNYCAIDRDSCVTPEEKEKAARECMFSDFFITGANALSMDGQMVNIDGMGNRVSAIVYGPSNILVIAGMNKVCEDLDSAIVRARTVAAPINKQRFPNQLTPCISTGICADCKSDGCICNQILITRNCRPSGRIHVILVGENLGF